MKFTFKSLLLAAGLLVGSNVWAEELKLTSSESAYIDQANSDTNYDGSSQGNLQIYNTQYRDWGASDGTVKTNANGKIAFYKFDLSEIKALGATVTAATFSVYGNSAASSGACATVRVLGYNAEWSASTITAGNISNNVGTILGTINDTGSFQPVDSKDAYTIPWGGMTLEANVITYLNSAIAAGKDYVSFAITANNTRGGTVEVTANLTVTYTTAVTYDVTFSETNGVEAAIDMNGVDVTNGTKLTDGEYKYTAKAVGYEDYNGEFTVSGANMEVTFTLTAKPEYSYTVNATANDEVLETLASGSYYANDDVYYHFKQVLNYNGTLYQAAKIGDGYKTSFKLDTDNKVVSHAYSQPAAPITNLVFLAEGEDVFTRGTGSTADTRCSMGAGGYASTKTEFVTLPAGKYYLVLSNRCSGNRTDIHKFYKGDDAEPFYSVGGYGYNQEWKSEEFTLSEETTLYMQGGDANQYVDWLYIYGTETTEVSVEISPADYTTFSSEYTLNLDELPQGLEAYYVKESGINEGESTVTISPATGNVKAGVGLIFKGSGHNYSVSVGTAGAELEGNLLVAVKEETIAPQGSYVFAYKEGEYAETAAFYQVGEYEAKVPAGKAYLSKSASEAKVLRIVFGDENPTAIEAVAAETEADGALYNVAGQQVGSDYKGIVIKNGKKYLNK